MKLKTFFYISIIFALIVLASSTVYAQQIAVSCSAPCSIRFSSRYSTQQQQCRHRTVQVSIMPNLPSQTMYNVYIDVEGYQLHYLMESESNVFTIYVVQSGTNPNDYVHISRISSDVDNIYPNILICETIFCVVWFECQPSCSHHGSLDLMPPACPGDTDFGWSPGSGGGGGGGGCNCDWWNIPCWLGCIFSWLLDSILGLLRAFFNWIAEQIMNALPQPIKDFFSFMGQLFAFLGQLISQMISYIPYFLFTIALIFSFGLVYYVVEYGAVGIGMYFEMIYDMFRKFIELIMKVIEILVPF